MKLDIVSNILYCDRLIAMLDVEVNSIVYRTLMYKSTGRNSKEASRWFPMAGIFDRSALGALQKTFDGMHQGWIIKAGIIAGPDKTTLAFSQSENRFSFKADLDFEMISKALDSIKPKSVSAVYGYDCSDRDYATINNSLISFLKVVKLNANL